MNEVINTLNAAEPGFRSFKTPRAPEAGNRSNALVPLVYFLPRTRKPQTSPEVREVTEAWGTPGRRRPQRDWPGHLATSRHPQGNGPAGTLPADRALRRCTRPEPAAAGPRAARRRLRTRPAHCGRARPIPGAAGGRAPRPTEGALRHCGPASPLPAPSRPWVSCWLAHARGAFHTGWVQRRSRPRGPSQTSASEFPPCASAVSNVRARPLFSGLVCLTFRGLRRGNSPLLPDLSRAGPEPNL